MVDCEDVHRRSKVEMEGRVEATVNDDNDDDDNED